MARPLHCFSTDLEEIDVDSLDTPVTGTARVKRGMAEMLKGGVIMDVVTAEPVSYTHLTLPTNREV